MYYNLIKISLFLLSFISIFLPGITNRDLAEFHFGILLFLAIIEIAQVKAISLFLVWIAGFVYIILSEMIVSDYGAEYGNTIRFLLIANNLLLIGYSVANNNNYNFLSRKAHNKISGWFVLVLLFLFITYLYLQYPSVERTLLQGRQLRNTLGTTTVSSMFINTLSICLPSLIAYYIVKIKGMSKWFALLLALPIFVFLFILATRYRFFFSIVPFLLIANFFHFEKIKLKYLIALLLLAVCIVSVTNYSKIHRNERFSITYQTDKPIRVIDNNTDYIYMFAKQCSPEGTVEMMRLGERYFEDHPYTYGKSIGFIFYFWVPRAFWSEKPTQVDYWLPRYYFDMADTASTSSGFMGELRADFGYFSLLLIFLFGILLKKANSLLITYDFGRKPCYESMYVSLLIPTTFFCVRGLNTSIMTFFCEVGLLFIIQRLLVKSNR